jgi:hypothetical protein
VAKPLPAPGLPSPKPHPKPITVPPFPDSSPRKQDALTGVPINFLLGCSDGDLASYELAQLAKVSDLRKQLHEVLDQIIDQMAQAGLAAWFRSTDRNALKAALENHEDAFTWAKRMIREKQRRPEELIPAASLPPGAAHLAAALRYQQRNVEEGKCAVCPSPLAPHSVRYCERHLEIARLRKTPKGIRGEAPPGSVDWLYGGGVFESRKGPTDLVKSRAKRAKKLGRKRSEK